MDFEVELIHRDNINVAYILRLIAGMHSTRSDQETQKQRKRILDIVSGDVELRNKRELIKKFINSNLPTIENAEKVFEEFTSYWDRGKREAFERFCRDKNVDPEKLREVIG